MSTLYSSGVALDMDHTALGDLRESSSLLTSTKSLRQRMSEDGYLFFRGYLDAELVQAARDEILLKYAIVGEVDSAHPLDEAVYCDTNALHSINLRAFAKSVREGKCYRDVVLHENLIDLHEKLLGGAVRPFDFRWPRFARPGEGCGVHCDGPYLTRGTNRIFSSWIPLGRVSRLEGALMILERGPRHEDLLKKYLSMDADRDQLEWIGDPRATQERFGTRWLTTDFQAGDVLCFAMNTVHAALDNQSPTRRCRLSSDSRYQLASEPLDERWNGENPIAHGREKVFFPGLGSWNNKDFQDEWKTVDDNGRMVIPS